MWKKTNNSLYRKFEFKDFDEAFAFISQVAEVARGLNHHPKITNVYNVVELWLTSHDAGNTVTDKDTEFASQIDKLFEPPPGEPTAVKGASGRTLVSAKLFTDGGSRGNPGPSAIGFVLLDMEDNVVKKESAYLGVTTNNQAEYQALQAGLEEAINMNVKFLDVYMDSQLVVNQVNGDWKIKHQELLPIYDNIQSLKPKFKKITFSYVPRAMNKLADEMVNECLDAQ